MSQVKLIWITPSPQQVISDCARVSNPSNQGKDGTKLLKYLIEHKHWSPFEMASACVEIETTRDIGRQILRHRSFSFQEFSQRYAEATEFETREARLQDLKNRQNSLMNGNYELEDWWRKLQETTTVYSEYYYKLALELGIAKEVARAILPEGLTMSKMYMAGTIRSFIHYIQVRTDPSTQKEHREVAEKIKGVLSEHIPFIGEINQIL